MLGIINRKICAGGSSLLVHPKYFCNLSFINVWYVEFVVAVILILQLIFSLIVNAGLGRLPDSPCSGLVPPRRH